MIRSMDLIRSFYVGFVALIVASSLSVSCSDDEETERKPGQEIDGSDVRFEDLRGRWVESGNDDLANIGVLNRFAALHFGTAGEIRDIYGSRFSEPLADLAAQSPDARVVVQAVFKDTQYTISHFRISDGRLDLTDIVGAGPSTVTDEDVTAPHATIIVTDVAAEQTLNGVIDRTEGIDFLQTWAKVEHCNSVGSATRWAVFSAPSPVVDVLGNTWGLGTTITLTDVITNGTEFFMPADGCGVVKYSGAPQVLHPSLALGDQLYMIGSPVNGDQTAPGRDTIIVGTRAMDSDSWISSEIPLAVPATFSDLIARQDSGAMTILSRTDGTACVLSIFADGTTDCSEITPPSDVNYVPENTFLSPDGTLLSVAPVDDARFIDLSSLLLSLSPGDTSWSVTEVPIPLRSWIGPTRLLDDGTIMSFTANFNTANQTKSTNRYGLMELRDGAITTTRVAEATGRFIGDILPDGTGVFTIGDESSLSVGIPTHFAYAGSVDLDGRYEVGNFNTTSKVSDALFTPPFPPSPQLPARPHLAGSETGYVAITNGYGFGYIKPPNDLLPGVSTLTLDVTGMPDGGTLTVGTGDDATDCSTYPCEVGGLIESALVPLRFVLPVGYAPVQYETRRPDDETGFYGEFETEGDDFAYYLWTNLVEGNQSLPTEGDNHTLTIRIGEVPVADMASETVGNDEYWISNHSFGEKTAVLHAHDQELVVRGDDGIPFVYPASTHFLRRIDVTSVVWETPTTVSDDAQVAISSAGNVALVADSGTVGETTWDTAAGKATIAHFSAEDGSLDRVSELDVGGAVYVDLVGCEPSGVVYLSGRSGGPIPALGLTESSDYVAAFNKDGTRAWTWSRTVADGPGFVDVPQVLLDDSESGDVAVAVLFTHASSPGETDAPFEVLGLGEDGEVAESFTGTFTSRVGMSLSVLPGGPVVSLLAPDGAVELDGQLIGATTAAQASFIIAFDWDGDITRSFQMPDIYQVEGVAQLPDSRFIVAGSSTVSVEGEGVFTLERGNVQHVHALDDGHLTFVYTSPFGVRYSVRRLNPAGF